MIKKKTSSMGIEKSVGPSTLLGGYDQTWCLIRYESQGVVQMTDI